MITEQTGQAVTTLITPFGSGLTQEGEINSNVLHACEVGGIKFVVGIAGMRQPVANQTESGYTIYGVGRVMPDDTQPSDALLQSLTGQVEWWTRDNQDRAINN